MILSLRLPFATAALTLAFGFLSPSLKNPTTDLAPLAQSAAPSTTISDQQEKQKLISFISQRYSKSPVLVSRIVDETTSQARQKGIDPLLFLALISVESSFNPQAKSQMGAVGLSQVLPRAHPDKMAAIRRAGKSPTDISENIRLGLNILAEYRTIHNGDMRLALLRYNGSLKDKNGRYARKVLAAHAAFENAVNRQPMQASGLVGSTL